MWKERARTTPYRYMSAVVAKKQRSRDDQSATMSVVGDRRSAGCLSRGRFSECFSKPCIGSLEIMFGVCFVRVA